MRLRPRLDDEPRRVAARLRHVQRVRADPAVRAGARVDRLRLRRDRHAGRASSSSPRRSRCWSFAPARRPALEHRRLEGAARARRDRDRALVRRARARRARSWEIYLASTLLGIGIGLAFASLANLIVEAVPRDQTGRRHRHEHDRPHDRRRDRRPGRGQHPRRATRSPTATRPSTATRSRSPICFVVMIGAVLASLLVPGPQARGRGAARRAGRRAAPRRRVGASPTMGRWRSISKPASTACTRPSSRTSSPSARASPKRAEEGGPQGRGGAGRGAAQAVGSGVDGEPARAAQAQGPRTRCSRPARSSSRRSRRCSPAAGARRSTTARRREQAALKRLRDDAAWVLGKRATDATLERVVSTLGSAAVTEDGRARLVEGRLTGDIEPQGFEAFAAARAGLHPRAGAEEAARAEACRAEPRNDAAERRKAQQAAVAAAHEKLQAAREREAGLTERPPRGRARASRRRARRSRRPSARPSRLEAERSRGRRRRRGRAPRARRREEGLTASARRRGRAQHRVEQTREALVELGAAQVQELARALLALADDRRRRAGS